MTYMDFPSEHWLRIRTNNVIERVNREIKRRTRVIGTFLDAEISIDASMCKITLYSEQ